MRVVVLTSSYPRTPEDPSGHFVRTSARALAAEGHEVHVIAPGGSPFSAPHRDDRLIVHPAGGGALFAWPGALARAKEAPFRLLSLGSFAVGVIARLRALGTMDRVVAHWILPSAVPLAIAATHAPLDVMAHGADVRVLLAVSRDAREQVISALFSHGARFTFAAQSLLTALEQSLAPSLAAALVARSHVEPPPIDVPQVASRAAALRGTVALATGERLAVTVGRLLSSKRVDLAIDAAQRSGVHLVVVGDGPTRSALEQRAAGARVTFTGALPRREALAWIAAADVLLHPSAMEAAPSVVREARALRVPVVACDAGDVTAWARNDEGIQVVEATEEALAQAILR